MAIVEFKRLTPSANVPEYKTLGSAGADLVSVEDVFIPPGEVAVVSVGFSVAVCPGYEIQIRPRSGLAAHYGVTVLNTPGTIDSDYRGPVKVILINHGKEDFRINCGDRIAQMVLARVEQAEFNIVEELDVTGRGTGGFGSTGRS